MYRTEVTSLLTAYTDGDRNALDQVLPFVYEQLKEIAHARLRNERADHTLNTTGLVHEAYLKLINVNQVHWQNRVHFFATASRIMRRILVNYARDRKRIKRGSGAPRLELDEEMLIPDSQVEVFLNLDDTLNRLEIAYPRTAEVVLHRYFGGLTNEQIAEVLGVSLSTVERELRFARAWLCREWES